MSDWGKPILKISVAWVSVVMCAVAVCAPTAVLLAAETKDAPAVKSVHDQIAAIENTYALANDKLSSIISVAITSKDNLSAEDHEQLNDQANAALGIARAVLHKSDSVTAPPINDPAVAAHIKSVISLHKQWAAIQVKKMAAFFGANPDIESAARFGKRADDLATREATDLILAYQMVGLKLE